MINIERLAARQKRVSGWKLILKSNTLPEGMEAIFKEKLSSYIKLLSEVVYNEQEDKKDSEEAGNDDANLSLEKKVNNLRSLERELEDLENESRLHARP